MEPSGLASLEVQGNTASDDVLDDILAVCKGAKAEVAPGVVSDHCVSLAQDCSQRSATRLLSTCSAQSEREVHDRLCVPFVALTCPQPTRNQMKLEPNLEI